MPKNLSEIKKKITAITAEIPNFNTDERKEIKKNNKLIDTYVDDLSQVSDILLTELKNRYQDLIPNKSSSFNSDELMETEQLLKYLSPMSFLTTLAFDKNLYEIKYSNSLDCINANILDILNKFSLVGLPLTIDDFSYSLPVYKYMNSFLSLKDDENFSLQIKDTFESLYWECPSLINHLYLSFVNLLDKHQDKFISYIKMNIPAYADYDTTLSNFYQLVKTHHEYELTDAGLVYERFLNNELRLDDHLPDSILQKETITKFVNYDEYQTMSPEERHHFYEQITNIYHDLRESVWLTKYAYLIKKVREIYANKTNYTNDLRNFQKGIKNLNKQRLSINNKLFAIYHKCEIKPSNHLLKKYNNLFNKANNKLEEIIASYNTYDEILFINNIITNLDDDSTYYDVFKIFENNYSYLLNFMKNETGDYQDFTNFLYYPNLNISKSLPFINEVDIETKLNDKYDLYDLEINLTDKDKLISDLEYLIRLSLYEQHHLNLTNYKLVFDIKKLLGE